MPTRLIALLLLLFTTTARAQPLPAAGSLAYGPRGQSHAWVAVPVTAPAILHLAPRSAALDQARDAIKAAAPGTTRLAAPLVEMPTAMAAWENQLYILFAPTPPKTQGGAPRAPVLALGAYPGPMGSVWAFDNIDGRLRVLPSLPVDGHVISFVGTARGPAALVRRAGETQLLVLDLLTTGATQDAWRQLALPEGVTQNPAGLSLISTARGLGLVRLLPQNDAQEPQSANGLWSGVLRVGVPGSESPLSLTWSFRPLSMGLFASQGETAPAPQGPVYRIHGTGAGAVGDGIIVYTTRDIGQDGPQLRVWNPTGNGTNLLATLPDVSSEYGLAPLDDAGRLAVVWTVGAPAPAQSSDRKGNPAPPEIRLAEISVADGSIIYTGPAIGKGPVSSDELRLLAVAMVAVMALILVFVLRPEESRAPVNLPRDVALAEPGRRIIGSIIDLILAALVAGSLTGRSPMDLILLVGVFTDAEGMLGLLMMLGTGFVLSTLGEWLFARSIGKALTGSAVAVPRIVDMPDPENASTKERVPTLDRPTLWRAAVRNLIKWFLPPVAMMGLSAPDHRHRGDVSAGTVVVVPINDAD